MSVPFLCYAPSFLNVRRVVHSASKKTRVTARVTSRSKVVIPDLTVGIFNEFLKAGRLCDAEWKKDCVKRELVRQ